MGRGRFVIIVLIAVIISSLFVAAAQIDSEVLQKIQTQPEVSVIVILKEPVIDSSQTSQQETLGTLNVNQKATTEKEVQRDNKRNNLEERKNAIKDSQLRVLQKINFQDKDNKLKIEKKEIIEIYQETTKENKSINQLNQQTIQTNSQNNRKNNEENSENNKEFELTNVYENINAFSGKINQQGLQKLQQNPEVEAIYFNQLLQVSLDQSIPQINADTAWRVQLNNYNLTGELETVCMIDSGIDNSHPAFQDKILDQYCYCSLQNTDGQPCCPDNTNEDNNASDDNGHGTQTAGVAIGNFTTYTGVAQDAKAVVIKVCNASGTCGTADVISAIDRCTSNASVFNISIISMSLGGGGPFNSFCNGISLATPINAAVAANISVVVSSGNNGFTNGISSPACVEAATPVGAVTDADAIFYNRGNILDLLAPGITIRTPNLGGGTTSVSGTSYSAPHVAGAIAIFRQYWRLAYNKIPSPSEIEEKFRKTGQQIDDSGGSGRNYSRIDVFAALQPLVNFTSPTPSNNDVINSVTVNATTDVNISLALLEWHYNNGTIRNFSMTRNNDTNFEFTLTEFNDGNDFFRVYANDTGNITGVSNTINVTIDQTNPSVNITNPVNSSNYTSSNQYFNATILETHIDDVLFQFTNASGNDFNVTATNNSGEWYVLLDLSTLNNGQQTMTVFANDTASNVNNTEVLTFFVDRNPPTVTVNFPTSGSNFTSTIGNQTFNVSVIDEVTSVDSVLFSFNNASGTSFNVTAINQSGYWTSSYNLSRLTEGSHIVTVFANDSLGNLNNSVTINFTLDNTAPSISVNSPNNGQNYTFFSSNQTFNATVNDATLNIDTALFMFDNASGNDFNLTATNNSGYWSVEYNVSLLTDGSHAVTIFANDSVGNVNNSETISFTVNTNSPVVSLNNPVNGFNSSNTTLIMNCSAQDNGLLRNLTLYGNWSGWHANSTTSVNGSSNSTLFTVNLNNGYYVWNCLATDSTGNYSFATNNYSFRVDTVFTNISTATVSSVSASSATISWTTNESTNSTVNYGTSSLDSKQTSAALTTSHSITLSGLSASTSYIFNVTSCDPAGNCNSTAQDGFTTSANPVVSGGSSGGGSGGGGGGGGGSTTSSASESSEEDSESETENLDSLDSGNVNVDNQEEFAEELIQEQAEEESKGFFKSVGTFFKNVLFSFGSFFKWLFEI